ncbi:MAG TPA: type I-D CRISPR-associated helicase Cas3' [Ktedonobacteraceae bacterium]|nr:type I-D CRISPR-associated helicase Cas3' [Ktedonobacteraceae bacterium]
MTIVLDILPVYSEEHPDPKYQIGSVRLLKHQVATLDAFRDPAIDVIFNTAMTGDGKSLAAYFPAFEEQLRVIGMYPTNELIQDQFSAMSNYETSLHIKLPRSDMMYSARINQLMLEHDERWRFEEVRKLLERNGLLLTNPDLIHLIMSHQYGWDHMGKELPVTLGAYFDYFLFDEFHVFGIPQVISVMNMLGYLQVNYQNKPAERKKFLFLSATPGDLLKKSLERGGMRCKIIEGSYTSSQQQGYRCILQPCRLTLHEVNQELSTEKWVQEHLAALLDFFKQHEGSKAAILVYSVATARRLVAQLKKYFEPHGISVGENTGLASREERRASYSKQILVGTSTVDIGVDFHINYLIFEAFSAGGFLQRFGRLGRHPGFPTYQAHALVPRFVLERLQQRFEGEMEVERSRFNAEIRTVFPTEQEFNLYTQCWGVVQAAQVIMELEKQKKVDANQAFATALCEQYERFYGTPEKPAMERALKKYWGLSKNAPQIVEELRSFRGQSPLSCGIWDTTDQSLKTYDLFFLLSNANFEVIEEELFLQEVQRRGLDEREFRKQLLYLRVLQYVPERMYLTLGLRHNLAENAHILHHAVVLDDFFVREPRPVWLDRVNGRLKRVKLPCILSPIPVAELKQRLRLGGIFPLYRLRDGLGHEYSVAFGQEALLLDSLLFYQKVKDDRAMML